ncbi:MAG: ABC transporter substrate-binding protein [Firmicutes bacterium]|nr:ABC transporter substrate-binding protein [Bacillota bacterium]
MQFQRISASRILLLMAVIMFLVLPGPTLAQDSPGTGFPVVVIDGLGREISIRKPPQRIVSLTPSVTENLFALGLDEQIVGVSNYSDYPAAAQSKPVVGDAFQLNYEAILLLEPDLIIGDAQLVKNYMVKLEELGLPVLAINPANLQEVMDSMLLLGQATGAISAATRVTAEMQEQVHYVQTAIQDLPQKARPLVFVEVWDEPLMTCGPGSFMQELIELAGGHNLAADAGGAWIEYSSELVVERDPDVILLTRPYRDELMARSAWQGISAVKEGRVVEVDSDPFVRTTPRLADALVDLAAILHPEKFQ